MLSLSSCINSLAEELALNSAIASWATALYGKVHKIYVNLDLRNPPDEADCPYIALYPQGQVYGRERRDQVIDLEVVCCVNDAATIVHATGEGEEAVPIANLVEYAGVRRLEDFRRLAEKAIAAVAIGNATVSVGESDYETIDYFPFFMVGQRFTITDYLCIGEDPLA
jgi:hypothetical protein